MNNFCAVVIGAVVAVMISMNGALAGFTGNPAASVIIHVVGLVTIIAVLFFTKSKVTVKKGIPVYLYSAGAIGVFTVLLNNLTASTLGVALTLALGLLGQSVASIVVDHFGLFGMKLSRFNRKKIAGLAVMAAGIAAMTIF